MVAVSAPSAGSRSDCGNFRINCSGVCLWRFLINIVD